LFVRHEVPPTTITTTTTNIGDNYVNSGFRHGVNEIFILLGYHTV